MRLQLSWLKNILLDPKKSRIAFDFGFTIFVSGVFSSVSLLLQQDALPLWLVAVFPFLLVVVNYMFGLYSSQTTAPLIIKTSLLLLSSTFVTLLFLNPLAVNSTLVLLGFVSFLLMLMPRLLFNLKGIVGKPSMAKIMRMVEGENLPVLIVGGAGYIGSHLVEQFLAAGHKVRVLDSFNYGRESLKAFEKNPNLEIQVGDVTNIFDITRALQDVGGVIHLAGIVGDPACALDEKLTKHVNIVSTRILKDAVKAVGVQRFIFASSCSVYGSNEATVSELSELNPVSLYAKTKIGSETELLADPDDNFHPIILRFATVFGHSRRMRFDLVVNLFTAQALQNGQLTVSGSDQWRPFIHVSDVARAIKLAYVAPLEKVSRQIFNVGDDSLNFTIAGVADAVIAVAANHRKKVTIKHIPFSQDKRNYSVSFQKIQKILGFKSEIDLSAGIEEMFQNLSKKHYGKKYTDNIYSNLEMTKSLMEQFATKEYRANHYSMLSELSE
jgi:nucleoside-diphosphate-sugar epimerase